MRSQIAFILCYRIVFRPRHSIYFGNNGLSSSLPKLPISAYQMQGYPECCAVWSRVGSCLFTAGDVFGDFYRFTNITVSLLIEILLQNQILWEFVLLLSCFSLFLFVYQSITLPALILNLQLIQLINFKSVQNVLRNEQIYYSPLERASNLPKKTKENALAVVMGLWYSVSALYQLVIRYRDISSWWGIC